MFDIATLCFQFGFYIFHISILIGILNYDSDLVSGQYPQTNCGIAYYLILIKTQQ